jgi:hypothetical protein
MNNEIKNEHARQSLYAIGLLESILGQLKATKDAVSSGKEQATWGDVEELKSILPTLQDIEDRIYGCGEYAPENRASTGGRR